MRQLIHTFEIGEGEDEKVIQIEKMTAGDVLSTIVKATHIYKNGGDIDKLIENKVLKNLKIDEKDATTEDLEIYEYIDLLAAAIEFQFDFEMLGKSRFLKKMGLDTSKLKTKMETLVTSSMEEKIVKQEEN